MPRPLLLSSNQGLRRPGATPALLTIRAKGEAKGERLGGGTDDPTLPRPPMPVPARASDDAQLPMAPPPGAAAAAAGASAPGDFAAAYGVGPQRLTDRGRPAAPVPMAGTQAGAQIVQNFMTEAAMAAPHGAAAAGSGATALVAAIRPQRPQAEGDRVPATPPHGDRIPATPIRRPQGPPPKTTAPTAAPQITHPPPTYLGRVTPGKRPAAEMAATAAASSKRSRRSPAQTWWRNHFETNEGYDARYWSRHLGCWIYVDDADQEYVFVHDLDDHFFAIYCRMVGRPHVRRADFSRTQTLIIGPVFSGDRRFWERDFYDPSFFRR